MIRDSRNRRGSVAAALVTAVVILLTSVVAEAGDADGVLGYSMRLKNKDITTGETGGTGGSGLVTGMPTNTKPAIGEPAFTSPRLVFVIVPGFAFVYRASWLLVLERAR